jgi:hypothetical protein
MESLTKRGRNEELGGFISLEEARELCGGEWWELPECRGIGGPAKQIWGWNSGDMYLGSWRPWGPGGLLVQHGLGVAYSSKNHQISMANWFDGLMMGFGQIFWPEYSEVWKQNLLVDSPITSQGPQPIHGMPFHLKGRFFNAQVDD